MKQSEETSYKAVFYSGDKKISESKIPVTREEAEKEIENMNDLYRVLKYTPWNRAVIEEVNHE